jgi:peptidase E
MLASDVITITILFIVVSIAQAYKAVFVSSLANLIYENFIHFITQQKSSLGSLTDFVYIPTAYYAYEASSPMSKNEHKRKMREIANRKMMYIADTFTLLNPILLELDDLDNTQSIKTILSHANVIYVDGGNTFYLQKYILSTGFWAFAQTSLDKGCLYIGESAGGIAATKSIKTAYWKGWDDPGAATDVDWNEVTVVGGGLADFSLFMHHDEEYYGDLVKLKTPELGHDLVSLSDNEFIVVDTDAKQLHAKYRVINGRLIYL